MKRIAFLFLFVSLFYNALGYYLMFAQQDEQAWVSTIENTPDSKLK
jgi:succinate dehydrogenase/fumarate reductase cytochrome b subunit